VDTARRGIRPHKVYGVYFVLSALSFKFVDLGLASTSTKESLLQQAGPEGTRLHSSWQQGKAFTTQAHVRSRMPSPHTLTTTLGCLLIHIALPRFLAAPPDLEGSETGGHMIGQTASVIGHVVFRLEILSSIVEMVRCCL
jgi:hypothetical protein